MTTADTAALRALADARDASGQSTTRLFNADLRALCDGYDEAQRLRGVCHEQEARAEAAEATIGRVEALRGEARAAGNRTGFLDLLDAALADAPNGHGGGA